MEVGVRYDVDCSTLHPLTHGLRVLMKILHDMELRRPLYYFTLPGIVLATIGVGIGLELLRIFYQDGNMQYGPTLLMVLLTLVGSFMAMTGIILHTMSKMINGAMDGIQDSWIRKQGNVYSAVKSAKDASGAMAQEGLQ